MQFFSDKKCLELFGKYLFTDDPVEGLGMESYPSYYKYKPELNTEAEQDIFWTVQMDWYSKWKRSPEVLQSFAYLCSCKKSRHLKKLLDPGNNRTLYRGLHLEKKQKNIMISLLNLPKPHRKQIFGTSWLGANYTYKPRHEIESWTDSVYSAFLFAAPNGALNTTRAKYLQLQYMKEMEKGYEMLLKRKLDKKECSDLILTKGLSLIFESRSDNYTVMRPEMSNEMFGMMTGMKPENEVVRLSKNPMKPGIVWFPEDVVKMYNKSDKLSGKPKTFSIFTKKDDFIKPARWIKPRQQDFQKEWKIEWNLQMKPVYGDLFPKYDDFKKHVSRHGKTVSITHAIDATIERRSRRNYFEDLISLLKTYKSWGTPYRNERTVAALDERIRTGGTMAMPIILNFVGREWKNPWAKSKGSHKVILGGNTRSDIAFWYNPNIKVFQLTLNSKDFMR